MQPMSDLVRSQAKLFPKGTRLTKSEEDVLITKWQKDGDLAARDKVAWNNMGTVYACALTAHTIGGGELEDLVSESCLGMMHAFDLYDPQNGARFSSYAYNWCKAHTMNWFDRSKTVSWRGRVTRERSNFAIRAYNEAMLLTGSREQALLAAGKAIEIEDEGTVVSILRSRESDRGYDYASKYEQGKEMTPLPHLAHISNPVDVSMVHGSSMCAAPDDGAHDSMRRERMRDLVHDALGDLNEIERSLIQQAYLSGEDKPNLVDAWSKTQPKKVSRQRVNQIKSKAFDKIFKFVVRRGGIGDLLEAA